MTIKLTPQEAAALYKLFNKVVLINRPQSFDERLITALMIAIYKKFRNKWEGEPRKKYGVKLNDAEALAYRIYWRDNGLFDMPYEWNMVLKHCTQIEAELTDQITNQHNFYKFLNA
ncbi:hypothetical protein [Mucilaginibacter sp. L3T2-6]|uniref:hypothetical protein n=1 Tax=Mucilaginibacter sp. L3T2-6 TaxID=3062491 RepID=UPI0026754C42|nr:hypothetical protein [Mucilaginibacter sp. L3T2-6]MDO3641949.1 hypothetical protein [Mucilaginibacter sp. L3T2-6]MDV6214373.1 hypothetical protein [Mucilaginibacter sp. L3T2-6]